MKPEDYGQELESNYGRSESPVQPVLTGGMVEAMVWAASFSAEVRRWGINVDDMDLDSAVRIANAAAEAVRRVGL
jgi:uncharacterized protein